MGEAEGLAVGDRDGDFDGTDVGCGMDG